MAVTVNAFTLTMPDADYLGLNGAAAPNVATFGIFGQLPGLTAATAAGVTTVTVAAGLRQENTIRLLLQRLRRYQQTWVSGGVTITM